MRPTSGWWQSPNNNFRMLQQFKQTGTKAFALTGDNDDDGRNVMVKAHLKITSGELKYKFSKPVVGGKNQAKILECWSCLNKQINRYLL